MSLIKFLELHATKTPNKVVYTFLGGKVPISLTYAELSRKAKEVASALIELGAIQGDRILIVLPQSLDYLIAFFGCLYARVIAVPIYPPTRANQIQRMHNVGQDAQAQFAITDQHTIEILKNYQLETNKWSQLQIIDFTALDSIYRSHKLEMPEPETVAFLQYTSGSTGQPKGVIVTHANLLANFKMMERGLYMDENTRCISWLPLFHDMGLIGAALQMVYLGATLYLMTPLGFIRRPFAWLEAISTYQGTHSYAPNFAYEMCLLEITEEDKNQLDLSSWKLALNGSEPVRAPTINRFIEAFESCGFNPKAYYPSYGLAEATLFAAGGPPLAGPHYENIDAEQLKQGKSVLVTHSHTFAPTLVRCGKAVLGEEILIVEPNSCSQLGSREIGEIWLQGPHICAGYWDKPELTAQTFKATTSDTGIGPCLRTGDLGYLNEEGDLFIIGRCKDLIIIRGKNYAPQDFEHTVERCSALIKLNSVVAFSIDRDGEEYLVLAIEIRRLMTLSQMDELSNHIRANILAEHGVVANDIVFVKRAGIPKTTSGKLQRQLCKNYYVSGTLPLLQTSAEINSVVVVA